MSSINNQSVIQSLCPEHIVFAIDMDIEMGSEIKNNFTRLDLIKDEIAIFIHSKLRVNAQHRFSIVIIKGATVQVLDSSRTSIDTIFQYLKVMTPHKTSANHSDFEFGILINAINNLEKNDNIRVIFIYGRSSVLPHWTLNRTAKLCIDIFYIHKATSNEDKSKAQAIYDRLSEIGDTLSHRANFNAYINEFKENQTQKMHFWFIMCMKHQHKREAQQALPSLLSLPNILNISPNDISLVYQNEEMKNYSSLEQK